MIELRQGNLLEADAEALVNTVNCVGVMGKGVALQFKQAFPENFRRYEQACRAKEVQPGRMFIVETGRLSNPKYIINFPTKRHWKGKARLEDIRSGLKTLIEEVKRLGIHSIAVPPLGCGNGGLEWAEVRPLIEAAFAQVPEVRTLLFSPQAAPQAKSMPVATVLPNMTRARALLIHLMDRYRIPNYRLTLLEIQKLAYFLQVAGEPLRLQYVKGQYGPYAENLNHVLQRLEGHFLRGYGDRSRQAEISLLSGATTVASGVLANAPDARARLDRVSRLIQGFETPYGMELLTTIHWVAQEEPRAAEDIAKMIAGVYEWNARKRELLKREHIQKVWERLREQGWLGHSSNFAVSAQAEK
ncbi:MAG: macro domain-containing protein [Candidatus Binatia bacterium]